MEIGRRNDAFFNGPNAVLNTQAGYRKSLEFTGGKPLALSLIQMDPPMHARYRDLTAAWFQPGNLKSPRAAHPRAGAHRGGPHGGIGRDLRFRPGRWRCTIRCGSSWRSWACPKEDEALMLKLTQEMFGAQDPDLNESGGGSFTIKSDEQKLDMSSMMTMMAYFNELTEKRRARPTDDLSSVIANARIDGAAARSAGLDGLLHHRRHRRARHDLVLDRGRHVGAGGRTRASSPSSRPIPR